MLLLVYAIFGFFLWPRESKGSAYAIEGSVNQFSSATRQQSAWYHVLSEEKIADCRRAIQSCQLCLENCIDNRARSKARSYMVSYTTGLDSCKKKLKEMRTGLPEWCLNDGQGFFSTPNFVPSEDVCDRMDMGKCIDHWVRDLEGDYEAGIITDFDEEFQLGQKAKAYASAVHQTKLLLKEIEDIPKLLDLYKDEQDRKLLEQATKHLANPTRDATVFADPLYHGLENITKENRNLDLLITRNDLFTASVENKFVRRETVDKIPALLTSISRLENHVLSKKKETDAYLDDIKRISQTTAVLQKKATNLIYETTHAEDVDGAIEVADKELFELYLALRTERAFLSEANLKATFAKLRLVGVMRRLVWEISKRQSETGCGTADVLTF